MLSSTEARRHYERHASPRWPKALIQPEFSPHLCALILKGEDVPEDAAIPFYLSGARNSDDAGCFLPGFIRSFTERASSWDSLPLQGLAPAAQLNQLHQLMCEALSLLAEHWPDRAAYTRKWIPFVQWVQLADARTGTLLTSSTFPQFPHCAFLSAKALRHIPPSLVSAEDSTYALMENLFHEALHQQLSSSLIFEDSIRDDYDARACQRIPVPWRGSEWEPDRVFHATFVYSHLVALRSEAREKQLHGGASLELSSAYESGREALEYLTSQLPQVRTIFSPTGLGLFDEVAGLAKRTLAASLP